LDLAPTLEQRIAAANGSTENTTTAATAASDAFNSAKDTVGTVCGRHIRGCLRGPDSNFTGITGAWHTLAAWLAVIFAYGAIIGGIWVSYRNRDWFDVE
jgi:hypothetical protein